MYNPIQEMKDWQQACYEIQEIIDRMNDTSIRRTIAEIDALESEDDLSAKKLRRRDYLNAMHQLYDIRSYDPEEDYPPRISILDVYYQYKENKRPHTW